MHNIIEDMKGKIRVYCRIRPISDKEIELGSHDVTSVLDEFTTQVETKFGPKNFMYDAVFGPTST